MTRNSGNRRCSDHSSGNIRYVVVDTGGWLSSQKFSVPPHEMHPSSRHKDDFEISAGKQQFERLPGYQESDLDSEENWKKYQKRYQAARMMIPSSAAEVRIGHYAAAFGNASPARHNWHLLSSREQAELSSGFPRASNEVTIQSSAMGIGSRFSTFEQHLRQRRRDITRSRRTSSIGPLSDRGAESVAEEPKAV